MSNTFCEIGELPPGTSTDCHMPLCGRRAEYEVRLPRHLNKTLERNTCTDHIRNTILMMRLAYAAKAL